MKHVTEFPRKTAEVPDRGIAMQRDPLSARRHSLWAPLIARGGWPVRRRPETAMTATAPPLVMTAPLTAGEGETRALARSRAEEVPRRRV